MASSNHLRSVSYPPKSTYPILQKVEEELKKLKKAESSSTSLTETICIGLTGLARLYKCVDHVLGLPSSFQTLSLSFRTNQTQVKPLIEGSFRLLEICGNSKQILGILIEEIRGFGSLNKGSDVSSFFSLRKEISKTAKLLVTELRQLEGSLVSHKEFHDEFEVIRVLRCVSIINISVLESLLQFLAMPLMSSKVKSGKKFALFSKLLLVKKSKSEISEGKLQKTGNELSDVDVVLHAFDGDKVHLNLAKKRLKVLETALRGIEDGLNNSFRQLTNTRSSLMNTTPSVPQSI